MARRAAADISGTIAKEGARRCLVVGDAGAWSRTWTAARVEQFAELGGDDNPVHTDPAFAATTQFGRPIVHGMLYGSMFGTIFGATIPGSIYVSQNFRFKRPVFVGERVTALVEVTHVKPLGKRGALATCSTTITTEGGIAMEGTAAVLLPTPPVEEER
jgi:enoyl-CoA hydratase